MSEVGRDSEEHRGLNGGRNRLAHVHCAAEHDAVSRRVDECAVEIGGCLVDGRLCLGDHGARVGDLGFARAGAGDGFAHGDLRGVEIRPPDDLIARQRLRTHELDPCVLFGCAKPGEIRLRLSDGSCRLAERRPSLRQLALVEAGVEPGDHLAGTNDRVEVRLQGQYDAGHLGADIDRPRRLNCAGCEDTALDRSVADRRRRHLKVGRRLQGPPGSRTTRGGDDHEPEPFPAHDHRACSIGTRCRPLLRRSQAPDSLTNGCRGWAFGVLEDGRRRCWLSYRRRPRGTETSSSLRAGCRPLRFSIAWRSRYSI